MRPLLLTALVILILAQSTALVDAEDKPLFHLLLEDYGHRRIVDFPVHPGDHFQLHYIHSSDKTPVRDTFSIGDKGELMLIEEAFLWYGAGLEFQKHNDVHFTSEGRWSKVCLQRVFPELLIRVGRIAQQVLMIHGRSIRLDRLVKPGGGIRLSIANGEKRWKKMD